MIEPFEFEGIRLQAPQPSGETGSAIIQGKGSIDEQEIRSFSNLAKGMDDLKLDKQQIRVYQTKVGNPSTINSHEASLVPERVISLGVLGPKYEEPTVSMDTMKTTSELLSTFLDSDMSFVPSTNLHHAPPFSVNAPDTPFLNPGLTTVDARKVTVHWS
jgi:hypothetical protein